MKIKIGELFGSPPQADHLKRKFSIAVRSEDIPSHFVPTSEITGIVEIFRLEDDLVCILKNVKMCGNMSCSKCLEEGKKEVCFSNSEQIFYSKVQDVWGEESFCIDRKRFEIDIAPFVLQELIVHIPNTYSHDKGKCDAKILKRIEELENVSPPSPFANLKDLMQQNSERK